MAFQLKVTLPSNYPAVREAQKRILDAVADARFADAPAFAIKLALEESLINAVKHGNKHDAAKHVFVEAKVTPQLFEVWIEDQGAGFQRQEVPDPTAEENLTKTSGRGLLLIEAYMDKVEYTKGGRRVYLAKRNDDETAPPS